MGTLMIIFLLVLNARYAVFLHIKCCDTETYLKKNNSTYSCDKDGDKRLQIFTDETNFLGQRATGTCYDSPNITEYKISKGTVIDEKRMSVNFYPKCCPLGYFYHSMVHSCVQKTNLDEEFITERFVKVGLPDCGVIVDFHFTEEYKVEGGKLYRNETVKFMEGQFCVDKNENGTLIGRGCYQDLAMCYDGLRCLHKCCPDGKSFVNGSYCENTYIHGLNLSFTDRVKNPKDSYGIIHGYDCELYILKPKFSYYLEPNGEFYLFFNNTNAYRRYRLEDKSYCIDYVNKGSLNGFQFFMCLETAPVETKILVTRWAKIVSCLFMILILGVYLFLPEMMNLFGKILVSYCAARLVMFIFLTYAQFERHVRDTTCVTLSFFFSYMSMVSFSWLNVMCFNIWCTLGRSKSLTAQQRQSEIKKFLVYSLYAWGLPALLTLLTFLVYYLFETPYVIRPFLGRYKCSWELRPGNFGKILYYVMPLLILEIINVVLFIKTVIYCLKVRGEIKKMNDNKISTKHRTAIYNIDKEQLLLVLKLGVIMGILFVFEVVSSFSDFSKNAVTKYVEVVWDTINCLEGVFLFLIFICKVKVYRLCLNRLKISTRRKISASLQTYTTQMSEPLTQNPKN